MKTPGDSSSASSAGKKRHKRRAHATSEGPNECSSNDTCELCSSPASSSRGSSGDKKGVHSSPLLHGHGTNATSDPSLVTKFYCKAARLHGVLHHKMQATLSAGGADFTEDGVLLLGNQVTDIMSEALSVTRCIGSLSGGGGGYSNPGNPFVMLLSILLPPLRKFLAWTGTTRSVWYGAANPSSMYQQHAVVPTPAAESTARSNASNGNSRTAVSNPVLWTMLAQHNVIARITALLADISRLIERNEDESLSSSQGSSPSPSLASSSAALPAPSAAGSLNMLPIPQVHHIAVELEDEFSEYRVCLAELTECLIENLETIASRLCRPVLAKDASKARGSANEFIELLVLQILDPVAKRFVEAPSPSRLYLFPKLLDKCISVVIDEFILRPGVRMNEIAAAQVEKGAMFLRTWSLRVETDYNTRARALASSSPDHDHPHANAGGIHRRPSVILRGGSGDIKSQLRGTGNTPRRPESPASCGAGIRMYRANTSQDDTRGRMDARLELTTLDGFKRLDSHIKQWLRNDTAGPLPAVRSRGGNLAEGLRESIARTFTARNSGGSVRFEGERQ